MSAKTKETAEVYREVPAGVSLPPELGVLLTEITDMPDMRAALRKILAEYLDLKLEMLDAQIKHFETKWGMSFADFSEKCAKGQLDEDAYTYDVEKDFWAWEEAVTLKKHYESLPVPW